MTNNNNTSTIRKWLKRIGIAVAAFFGLFLLASIAMAIFGDVQVPKKAMPTEPPKKVVEVAPERVSEIEGMDAYLAAEMLPGYLPYEVMAALKKEGMEDESSHMKDGTLHHLKGGLNGLQISADITTWRAKGEGYSSGYMATAIAMNVGAAWRMCRLFRTKL